MTHDNQIANDMVVAFAQTVPVGRQIVDMDTIVSAETSTGQKAWAAASLMLDFVALLTVTPSGGPVSAYGETFQAVAKPVRPATQNLGRAAHGMKTVETPTQQSARTVRNVASDAGHAATNPTTVFGAVCFTEGTQVVTGMEQIEDEHGNLTTVYTTINIEDIQVGDLVYSYNTLTGETELAEVTATFALRSDHINYLTIIDEVGNEQVIETTDAHPFWVVTDTPDLERAARSVVDENGVILYHENIEPGLNGFWVEAKDLRVGDVFLGANGELSTLTNIVRVEQSGGIAVFNFTVDGNHNYFILAKEYDLGQTCVLVHNSNPCATPTLPAPGTIMPYGEWIIIRDAYREATGLSSKLTGHHPIAQKVLKTKGLDVNEAPVVIMTIGDHYKTANIGGKARKQSTDLVEGIIVGFNDGVLQRVVGNQFDELWKLTSEFLGWY